MLTRKIYLQNAFVPNAITINWYCRFREHREDEEETKGEFTRKDKGLERP